jgi:hypothetical protein
MGRRHMKRDLRKQDGKGGAAETFILFRCHGFSSICLSFVFSILCGQIVSFFSLRRSRKTSVCMNTWIDGGTVCHVWHEM